MSDQLYKINLNDDFGETLEVSDASRWQLEMTGDLEVVVILHSDKAPTDVFNVGCFGRSIRICHPH